MQATDMLKIEGPLQTRCLKPEGARDILLLPVIPAKPACTSWACMEPRMPNTACFSLKLKPTDKKHITSRTARHGLPPEARGWTSGATTSRACLTTSHTLHMQPHVSASASWLAWHIHMPAALWGPPETDPKGGGPPPLLVATCMLRASIVSPLPCM